MIFVIVMVSVRYSAMVENWITIDYFLTYQEMDTWLRKVWYHKWIFFRQGLQIDLSLSMLGAHIAVVYGYVIGDYSLDVARQPFEELQMMG